MSALSWGPLSLLFIAGHLVKMCPLSFTRVSFCAFTCYYLQMWDFTLVGHVNLLLCVLVMLIYGLSRATFALFFLFLNPPPPNSSFRLHNSCKPLIKSPPTTLWHTILQSCWEKKIWVQTGFCKKCIKKFHIFSWLWYIYERLNR